MKKKVTEIIEKIEKYQKPTYKVKQRYNRQVVTRVKAEKRKGVDVFVYTLEIK